MNEKRSLVIILAVGALAAAGLGTGIWFQYGSIDEQRAKVVELKGSIDSSRKLVEGTSALEREVIVLRELSTTMKAVLPDNADLNNLVHTLQRFLQQSGVTISSLKKKSDAQAGREKNDFLPVAYTVSLEGDAFEFIDFMNLIESHSRFMRVPSFSLVAAQRSQLEKDGEPRHKVQLEVETFVYEPRKDEKQVKIDGFDRKKELLVGEIERRRQALVFGTYNYRGQRSRRDPWIDPRVPLQSDNPDVLSVQQQMEVVQKLVDQTKVVLEKWDLVEQAENVVAEMTLRAEFEELLAKLEEDVRLVQEAKSIVYIPSERKFQLEVLEVLNALRGTVSPDPAGKGPSEAALLEVESTMRDQQVRGEYQGVLEAFATIENRIGDLDLDAVRKPILVRIQALVVMARTVVEFQKFQIQVGGVVLIAECPAVARINGKSVQAGDFLLDEVLVRSISREEIQFLFRGVVFARRL